MKIDWKLVCTYDSFAESEHYFERGRPKVVVKSNKPNCTICNNSDGHQMKVQYMDCYKTECNGKCETRYKLMQCLSLSKCVIYSLNEHEIVAVSAPIEEQTKIKMRRGLSHSTKEAIETILNEKNLRVPNKIYIELTKNKDKYKLNYYPNLHQIQNYLKYRRVRCDDINNINGVEEYVNSQTCFSSSDVIFFGSDFGDGTDEKHFHLGITTKALLGNIHKSEIFHIDATYKIIKYNFPLIVFGCSDVRRRFHPISFMITSHETKDTYSHFFSRMLDLCSMSNIVLEPRYMVQDADQAMANAVIDAFSQCTIIMCYFHVKQNVIILIE